MGGFYLLQEIQLLLPSSPEGHYFCEGEFLFQEVTGETHHAFTPSTFKPALFLFKQLTDSTSAKLS